MKKKQELWKKIFFVIIVLGLGLGLGLWFCAYLNRSPFTTEPYNCGIKCWEQKNGLGFTRTNPCSY